jgi:hypothetical protein
LIIYSAEKGADESNRGKSPPDSRRNSSSRAEIKLAAGEALDDVVFHVEGAPLGRFGAVGVGAAHEVVAAVASSDEFCVAEHGKRFWFGAIIRVAGHGDVLCAMGTL